MSEQSTMSALQRKAQAGQERQKARAMTAARALRVSSAKSAEEELELPLAVIGLTETPSTTEKLFESLDESAMMIMLDAPDRTSAAAILDVALVGAVVQQQTMGRVNEIRENAPVRPLTRTDAALVAPWLDRLFKKAEVLPDNDHDKRLLDGWRFSAYVAESRLLSMALDAPEYVDFTLVFDIAGGVRQGRMKIFLPAGDSIAPPIDETSADPDEADRTMEAVVLPLQATLQVALCRLKWTLEEISALKVGDVLPLPDNVLDESEILTVMGRKITVGKLGQQNGKRAIRITAADFPNEGSADTASTFEEPGPAAQRASENHDRSVASGLDHMPDFNVPAGDTDLPDLMGADLADLPDLPDIPGGDLDDLPDLGALPDLPDLPEPGGAAHSPTPAMPADVDVDLPELPDLPDLPDISAMQ